MKRIKRGPGRPAEMADGEKISFRLPAEILQRVDAIAQRSGIPRSRVLRMATERWLRYHDRRGS